MPSDLTGKVFGSYQLVEQLGRGGMASVYRGYQESIDRSVAVKVLPQEFLHDPNFTARFIAEARTLARLTHSAILPLYDFGTANDVPYIVMPLMANGTLAERIARGALPIHEIIRILKPIAAALDYAHQRGVLHRDVKPSNILFDGNDAPFLADFGIAKALEASSSLTGTGVVGTPDFMSPEQARGEALDGRSDQYSLGAVLYQALTGRQLFRATTPMGVMLKHATEPPPPVRQIRPELPAPVDSVLQKALAKYPNDRFATVSDFISALGAAAAGQQTVVEPAIDSRTVVDTAKPPYTPPPARTGSIASGTPAPAKKAGTGGMLVGGSMGLMIGGALAVAAVICLCLGLAAWGSTLTATPTPPPTPTFTPRPPTPTPIPFIFSDDFSNHNGNWSTFTSDKGYVEYDSGELKLGTKSTEWYVWSNPGELTFRNVQVRATLRFSGGGTDTTIGLMCNYLDSNNYYYAGFDIAGNYAIIRYDGNSDIFLTGAGTWKQSPDIPHAAAYYDVAFDCTNDRLVLYVNGKAIDSVRDIALTSGNVGVFIWTNKETQGELRVDDFTVQQLP